MLDGYAAPRASSTTRCARGRRGARALRVGPRAGSPREWSVQQGHDLLERIEAEIRRAAAAVSVLTHLEPLGDPAAMADQDLHRHDARWHGPQMPQWQA